MPKKNHQLLQKLCYLPLTESYKYSFGREKLHLHVGTSFSIASTITIKIHSFIDSFLALWFKEETPLEQVTVVNQYLVHLFEINSTKDCISIAEVLLQWQILGRILTHLSFSWLLEIASIFIRSTQYLEKLSGILSII